MSLGLPGSGFTKPGNLHLDILMGRDEEIRPQDVLIGAPLSPRRTRTVQSLLLLCMRAV